MARVANELVDLKVDFVSIVDHPANPGARIVMTKRDGEVNLGGPRSFAMERRLVAKRAVEMSLRHKIHKMLIDRGRRAAGTDRTLGYVAAAVEHAVVADRDVAAARDVASLPLARRPADEALAELARLGHGETAGRIARLLR